MANIYTTETMTGSSSSSPKQPLMDEEIQYLSLMLEIIGQQNWKAFGYAIVKNPTLFASFARTIADSDELNGMTILHACVRFNPPHQIVKMLIDLNPDSPRRMDCLNRTPLHIAAGTRASQEVIDLLARAHPGACAVQDEDGKTPLHLACDSSCELFDDEGNNGSAAGNGVVSRDPPSYGIVRTLIKASPICVPLEDQDGMSALEHAIFSDAPIRVVKLLQYATKKQCEREQEKRNMKRARRVSEDSHEEERLRSAILPSFVSFGVVDVDSEKKLKQTRSRSDDFLVNDAPIAIPVTNSAQGEFAAYRRRGGVIMRHAASA